MPKKQWAISLGLLLLCLLLLFGMVQPYLTEKNTRQIQAQPENVRLKSDFSRFGPKLRLFFDGNGKTYEIPFPRGTTQDVLEAAEALKRVDGSVTVRIPSRRGLGRYLRVVELSVDGRVLCSLEAENARRKTGKWTAFFLEVFLTIPLYLLHGLWVVFRYGLFKPVPRKKT